MSRAGPQHAFAHQDDIRGSPSEDTTHELPQVRITPRDAGFLCSAIDDESHSDKFHELKNKAISAACIPQGAPIPVTYDEARFIEHVVEEKGAHGELKQRLEQELRRSSLNGGRLPAA